MTDENPLQVFVKAVVNAGPREDSTRVGSGGIVRRQAVDVSPFRRVNQAIYLMAMGAREATFRSIKTAAECLADEIINASKGSSNSYAIKKKDEIERVAKVSGVSVALGAGSAGSARSRHARRCTYRRVPTALPHPTPPLRRPTAERFF